MKDKNIVPTQQERVMREDDFLVSKTDLKDQVGSCFDLLANHPAVAGFER
ncbi:MAG: hypothetical protein IPG42_18675 [Betaproteobacteria bacterium]|jgi:hypothetical protein|nr:hypothetical protein [Betaproteobacteria bacterium]MBK7656511.1 hypothetical protein [Betaproteobacteria bacterium]MBP6645083.1 hypothetical protein [Burkholderiaceae bacterium]